MSPTATRRIFLRIIHPRLRHRRSQTIRLYLRNRGCTLLESLTRKTRKKRQSSAPLQGNGRCVHPPSTPFAHKRACAWGFSARACERRVGGYICGSGGGGESAGIYMCSNATLIEHGIAASERGMPNECKAPADILYARRRLTSIPHTVSCSPPTPPRLTRSLL